MFAAASKGSSSTMRMASSMRIDKVAISATLADRTRSRSRAIARRTPSSRGWL
jgi:hypothetical protein